MHTRNGVPNVCRCRPSHDSAGGALARLRAGDELRVRVGLRARVGWKSASFECGPRCPSCWSHAGVVHGLRRRCVGVRLRGGGLPGVGEPRDGLRERRFGVGMADVAAAVVLVAVPRMNAQVTPTTAMNSPGRKYESEIKNSMHENPRSPW